MKNVGGCRYRIDVSLDVPRSWHRTMHPRRGGVVVGFAANPAWADVVAAMRERRGVGARRSLEHELTPPPVSAEGLAFLDGSGEATPLGAAGAAVALLGPMYHQDGDFGVLADEWIAAHGLEFAVRASLELVELRYGQDRSSIGSVKPIVPRPDDGAQGGGLTLHRAVPTMLGRVRAALAVAPDDAYAAMLEVLAVGRTGSLLRRATAAFLASDQTAWVDADVDALVRLNAGGSAAVLLLASTTSLAHVEAVEPLLGYVERTDLLSPRMVHTLAEGVGSAIAGPLMRWQRDHSADADTRRAMLSTVAALPGDAAFQALLDHVYAKYVPSAVTEAAERFPRQALRLLAEAKPSSRITDLLRIQVGKHPELVDELLPGLTAEAAAAVRAVTAAPAQRVAPVESLPGVLAAPPWIGWVKVKPVVLTGLKCTDPPTIDWQPGERDAILARPPRRIRAELDVDEVAARIRAGTADDTAAEVFFETAPIDLARPLLSVWSPLHLWHMHHWLPVPIARFDLAALPLVMTIARRSPEDAAPHLARFTSPDVAVLMADWLARLKSMRKPAKAWLHSHPAAAARALVPPALGRAGTGRSSAEQALVALATAGHRDVVFEAARHYGAPAGAAIQALLDADPLLALPAKIPVRPDWAAATTLPPIHLRDNAAVLPATAVHHVLTMLAISKPDRRYAGIDIVKDVCEPASLAEFGRALLRCWLLAGAPPAHSWALEAQASIGDDRSAAELADFVRRWPYEGAHARAATGLDVLARFGTEAALTELHEIATKMKAKAVRSRAQANLQDAAEALGLTAEQLTDRLVPHFDLAPDGTLTLDYGPRQFIIGFDEQLKPRVANADGTRRKDLPKPAASDDAELADKAYQRFGALKTGVRKVATEQIRRLELAMVMQRRWSGAEFRQLFVRHPLLWQIARRLVWATFDPGGAFATAIRIAEDRTLADVADDPVKLDDDATFGVAHPIHLGAADPAWCEVFADYEILQPFQQLGRQVHALTDGERAATRLARFDGRKAESLRLLGLERRGWRFGERDGGYRSSVEHDLPDGRTLMVHLQPGIALASPTEHPEQDLADVFIHDGRGWSDEHRIPFETLDAVIASEILRDLTDTLK
jgi:hypothetical protein